MRILFLDDDDDLREVMGEFLAADEHDVVAVPSYAALVGLGDAIHRFHVAILDVNLGPRAPNGIDAYLWLKQRGFEGEIVFLSGHALSRAQVSDRLGPSLGDGVRLLEKPISIEELDQVLEEVQR